MVIDVDKLLRADAAGWQNEIEQAVPGSAPSEVSPSEFVHRLTLRTDEDHRGRLAGSVLAAAVLVLILFAVGFAVAKRPGSAPSTLRPAATPSSSVDPKRPQPPRNLSAVGMRPTPATSAELDSRSLSMPWRLSAINDKAKTVEIYFAEGDGSCVVPQGVHVEQTSTSVTIESVSNQTASAGEACPSVLKIGWVTVQLTSALGDRALLHPAVASGWTLPAD